MTAIAIAILAAQRASAVRQDLQSSRSQPVCENYTGPEPGEKPEHCGMSVPLRSIAFRWSCDEFDHRQPLSSISYLVRYTLTVCLIGARAEYSKRSH
jgi:hypothetical protein